MNLKIFRSNSVDTAILPAVTGRLAFAPPHTNLPGDVLVVVFLRGAADALNLIVPHGDPEYYRLRPNLGIARPDDHRERAGRRAVDLDGFFGLHPALLPLLPAWQDRKLVIVHACGAPDESRSHFRAMELMERGVEDERGPASGWIGRHLASMERQNPSPLRAVSFGQNPARSLSGAVSVSTMRSITDFHYQGDSQRMAQHLAAINQLYGGGDPFSRIGQDTLEIMTRLQGLEPARYRPRGGLEYPATEFGQSLKSTAMLIKAQVGLEVAALDLGGWDTHFAQGSSQGLMANLLDELAGGLAAFIADLHGETANYLDRLSLVVMSEFGRRAAENGSLGTDHGHGGVMLLLGGGLAQGGRVLGAWPGLGSENLVGPGDLAVTTDYRDILADLCSRRLKNEKVEEIFPGHHPEQSGYYKVFQ
jgi:uncharacterized protein (DUF1501 family)